MKKTLVTICGKCFACVGLLLVLTGTSLYAQLKGSHLLGYNGMQAGTQGPAGINALAIPAYLYNAGKLKGSDGNTISDDVDLNSYVAGIGLSWVANTKILGANLGGTLLLPFATNKIEAANASMKTSFAFSDILLQPIQLGWHKPSADFIFSYQMYIPTGKYEVGGDNNSGLGQFGNELTAATTLKFGKKKDFHFATALSYELNSKKKDSEMKTGDNLSIEGGLGKTWYKKSKGPIPYIINAGAIYYMQFKASDDKIPTVNLPIVGPFTVTPPGDHIYAAGVETNVYIPQARSLFLVRWLGEFGAETRFQGSTFLVTWAYNIKSFAHPGEK